MHLRLACIARRTNLLALCAALAAPAACSDNRPAQPDAAPDVPATDAAMDAATDGGLEAATDGAMDALDSGAEGGAPRLAATVVSTRFVTREHMIASFEMQHSGEPLAQSMGRNPAGYDRNALPPDQYADPTVPDAGAPVRDLPGFASAIESYEYSKQPMNALALETGAGVALLYGPLVNATGANGTNAIPLLRDRIQRFALASHVGVPAVPGAMNGYVAVPPPAGDAQNPFGWRGLWPTMHPYRAFDSALNPVSGVSGRCSITPGDGDDGRAGATANPVGDYECDYVSLHVPDRAAQLERVITPGASGWAGWKYALWATNYLQIMHDTLGNSIGAVAPAELANVGSTGNAIVGTTAPPIGAPMPGMPGTYLGASDIEGFQAAVMIDSLDNAAQHWLSALTTTDGATLSGFASLASALAYDYNAPLRWFPGAIAVSEVDDPSGFPRPSGYAIASPDSDLLDLLGLLGAYSQLFALTDHNNSDVGGTQPARVYFDGSPFADDNQRADGEATTHDRALALLKVAFVSMDRLHRSSTGLLIDHVSFSAGTPTRGTTLSTPYAAYALVGLRALRRGLGGTLTLYSNNTPDTAVSTTALDETSMAGAPAGQSLTERLNELIQMHASVLLNSLTDASGGARPGFDVAGSVALPGEGDLDAHAASVRGLLEAYLATGNTAYRDRALSVFNHLDATFYDPRVRAYRRTPGATGAITFTPMRFALLQGALRGIYQLVGLQPGREALAARVLARLARLDKLVLNGWDDRNDNGTVDWPSECTNVSGGLPRGGLQMAERALTGELGLLGRVPASDRDHDCVPEVSYAHRPAALAAEIRFDEAP